MQVKLDEKQSVTIEQLDKLRAENEAADQELHKSQERASRVLEDVISHVHSPNFSNQVTAGFLGALEALKQEIQELKTESEISQLQVMEGVRLQKWGSTVVDADTAAKAPPAEAETAAKAPTPLQAAPGEVCELCFICLV